MLPKLKEFILNTPEKYWFIVKGYHIHKSFWGLVFLVTGFILTLLSFLWFGIILLFAGCSILTGNTNLKYGKNTLESKTNLEYC